MRGKPFEKGHVGGPGRPKGTGQIARCKAWADKYGFRFLERVAEGKEKDVNVNGKKIQIGARLRVETAEYLIDRGYGRAMQAHELKTGDLPATFTLQLGTSPVSGGGE